jgi:signal recognition particle receptor subunit beta
MSFVNYHTKEINCKIVYYGPGLSGKTTNIQYIHLKTASQQKSEIVSLNTENERTLFFDFFPLEVGEIRGFKTKFHLYTVPGQVFYEASRRLILRGVDGVVFVADSELAKMEQNLESLKSLEQNLIQQGSDLNRIPLVFQWNKRDLPNVTPVEDLSAKLNRFQAPEFSSIASRGDGVLETLQMISKMVLANIKDGLETTV